jgi:hypothetical protein
MPERKSLLFMESWFAPAASPMVLEPSTIKKAPETGVFTGTSAGGKMRRSVLLRAQNMQISIAGRNRRVRHQDAVDHRQHAAEDGLGRSEAVFLFGSFVLSVILS